MDDKQKALEAIKRAASKKIKPDLDKTKEKVVKRGVASLKDLGIGDDALKYAAGAAMAADAIKNQSLEGGIDLNDDLKLKGKLSPKEKAIKLLYNKSF